MPILQLYSEQSLVRRKQLHYHLITDSHHIIYCQKAVKWTACIIIFFSVCIIQISIPNQWTVPQLSIMIIYNRTWSILIEQFRIILSGDNLTYTFRKHKRRSRQIYRIGRSLKFCGTVHYSLQQPSQCPVQQSVSCLKQSLFSAR